MSYMALYRKFRPVEFEDVKGQDAIVKTLKNQIVAERIGHAYLFCGTRGTGKTTVAKIFAKAVNCEHPIEGSPCGKCPACQAIAAGASMNVIEIDAASNNGVDNVREIRENVEYRPTEGKYKVYIIDEVHMLSIGAFNALLKTLEEPPEYVIFILATTEAHKIPVTILSRCQRYDFKRISIDTIAGRLQELIEKEGWEVEEKAVRYLARMADGSMRDALSLLDQCAAFHIGERLTYDQVLEVLGAVDTEMFSRLLRELLAMDVHAVVESVDELVMQGRELTQLTLDFVWYLRNLLLAQSSDNMEDILDMSSENLARLQQEAQMIDGATLMHYIRVFSELNEKLKNATQKRVLLEVTLIKICRPQMEVQQDALLDRIRAIEKQLEEGIGIVARLPETAPAQQAEKKAVVKKEVPKALGEDIQNAVREFSAIVRETEGSLRSILQNAKPSVGDGDVLFIVCDNGFNAELINKTENIQLLQNLFAQKIGKKPDISIRYVDDGYRFEEQYVDLSDLIHMELTIEEE